MDKSVTSKDVPAAAEPSTSTGKTRKSKEVKKEDVDDNKEGGPSYTAMIAQAILSSHLRRATLSEIYEFMARTFDVLKKRGTGWRNCVRHTLSLNECFVKLHRPENGRSCNWTVHPNYFENFLRGDFRKRRLLRKKDRSMPWYESEGLSYAATLSYLRDSDMTYREQETARNTVSDNGAQLWAPYPQGHSYEATRSSSVAPALLPTAQTDDQAIRLLSASPSMPLQNRTQRMSPRSSVAAATPYDFSSIATDHLPDFTQQPSAGAQSYLLSAASGYSALHSHISSYSGMAPGKILNYTNHLGALHSDKPGSTYTSTLLLDSNKPFPYSTIISSEDKPVSYPYEVNEHAHTCQPFAPDSNCFACYLNAKSTHSAPRTEYFPGI